MELGALLELNLHNQTATVEEITDQALKEEKMEVALQKLEEVWTAVNFVASPYKEGSDIMLLAIAEEDYEMCVLLVSALVSRLVSARAVRWLMAPRSRVLNVAPLPRPRAGWRTTS
jgi:hypothetical protein